MNRRFRLFGLEFQTDLALDGFYGATSNSEASSRPTNGDVRIHTGRTLDEGWTDLAFRGTADTFVLEVPECARLTVTNGRDILVEPVVNADHGYVCLALFGSAMGVLLHQRGILPLHGSAVMVAGKGVAIVGPSGAGKSTLAAAMVKRGHRVLTDDICAAERGSDGHFWISPGPARMKLWEDAIERLGVDSGAVVEYLSGLSKMGVLLQDSDHSSEPQPLAGVVVVTPGDGPLPLMNPLTSFASRVEALVSFTYRQQYLFGSAQRRRHFSACTELAEKVPFLSIVRPRDGCFLDDLLVAVESVVR